MGKSLSQFCCVSPHITYIFSSSLFHISLEDTAFLSFAFSSNVGVYLHNLPNLPIFLTDENLLVWSFAILCILAIHTVKCVLRFVCTLLLICPASCIEMYGVLTNMYAGLTM